MRRVFAVSFVLLIACVSLALAQEASLVIPDGARSVEVARAGVIVRSGPSVHSKRRGTVRLGTRLPIEARVRGAGCPGGEWYRVGREQYVCETLVQVRREEPFGEAVPEVPAGEILPRQYAFVAFDGTWSYRRPGDYFRDDWVESLGQGFGIAVTGYEEAGGVRFARSLRGAWIPVDQLRFARGSQFQGVAIEEGAALDVAWTRREAQVRAWDGRRAGRVIRRTGRRELVHALEELDRGRQLRIADGEVLSARDVVRPSPFTPPASIGTDETWIDIELDTQTLVVFRGARAIYATLVSTGRAGRAHQTPLGEHRIWVKLAEDTMDDLERTDQESNYAIEGVPWVQYFAAGVGLHAAFWHDDFGRPRSHGCVNLAPRDARVLFGMTQPALPAGWDAILASEHDLGTLIRVR